MRSVALLSALTAAAVTIGNAPAQADPTRRMSEHASPASIPVNGSSPATVDGLWRGTFECSSAGNMFPVAVKPEFKVINGSGTWYPPNYTPNRNNNPNRNSVFTLAVSIDGSNVAVRIFTGHSEQEFYGRVDGDSIRASNKSCTPCRLREILQQAKDDTNG